MRHVIIGAGAAGITAAKTIRGLNPEDEIVLISKDEHVISRYMLHKYISGERNEDTLRFVPADFFEAGGIRWQKGAAVTRIDAQSKTVRYEGGEVAYDKLLIATGADSIIPPIGELRTAGNVFGLRHLADARAIRRMAQGAERIVIVGAGLVGLDAASAFIDMGKPPVVVEMAETILAVNLDAHTAAAYHERFTEAGCTFKLGRKVIGTVPGDGGRITHLELDGGERLPCDLVVVAAGVRPSLGFLEGSGIPFDRFVPVDDFMAADCPDVYAAGDVTGLSGVWPNAMKQGEVAAKNICGVPSFYEDRNVPKNTVHFFGLLTLSIGRIAPVQGDSVQTREYGGCYDRVVLNGGRVAGAILQGNVSGSGFWEYLIKSEIDVTNLDKPIWEISRADFTA